MKMPVILAAVLAVATSVPHQATSMPQQAVGAWTTIAAWDKKTTDNKGGYLDEIYPWLAEVNRTDQLAVIQGKCFSTCSFLLGAKHMCIYRSAVIYFHGINYDVAPTVVLPDDNKIVIATYSRLVQEWINRHHAMDSIKHVLLTGRTAIDQLGVPDCASVIPHHSQLRSPQS